MRSRRSAEQGNVLICALCTILIISLIGANVLRNCTVRFNVSSSQVRSWKESLFAAEAGGDIAYAQVRKTVIDPPHAFTGWDNSVAKHVSPVTTFGANNLVTSTVVDLFYNDPAGNAWYRSRSRGTAQVRGLRQTGMDDRMGAGTRGDSLLRKIDFNTDHFIATYGPNGDGVGLAQVPPSSSPYPSMTRRIEQISAPITPFEAAIKAAGTFYGLGSAAYVDSFRSSAGPYDPNVRNNPNDPRYADSQSGTVEINAAVATIQGSIYGNLYTNGGTVTKKTVNVSGVIDNNVPFSLKPLEMPNTTTWNYVATPTAVTGNTTIVPPQPGTAASPNYYLISYFVNNGNLLVNPVVINGTPQETYVTLSVTGDIGSSTSSQPTITVPASVHLKIYFTGNFQTKAENIVNTSGYSGNLQFYAISPTDPSVQQTINLNSGGGSNSGFSALFYAPSADFTINGAPDITGAIVCRNFYANGNVHWHYDRRLDTEGAAIDYRIASYVEDIR